MNKNIVIISNFYKETENSRPNLIYKYFKESDYDVKVLHSDFSHSEKKEEIKFMNSDFIAIKTLSYKKNISIKRIVSHVLFALSIIKTLKTMKIDLIYVNVPPNILGYMVAKYCKKNKIKLILDIIDLWPEALPISKKYKKILNITVNIPWKLLREKSLKLSNYIMTESEYFYKILKLENYRASKTVYLKKNHKIEYFEKIKSKNIIRIGYLGNVGQIYDFDSLIMICEKLTSYINVELTIIGEGEYRKTLINQLNEYGINYKFYGIINNETEKYKILKECDFGFNGYKNETEVALSYKSIDYFSYGLPIINSAKGDTWEFVKKRKIGINYSDINDKFILELLKLNKINLNFEVLKFFKENFSYESLKEELNIILQKIK